MARRSSPQILPFRIPFFRIFYSTTYTVLYIIVLAILAITPVSMIWQAIEQRAYQYTFMIGGTYVLVALLAIFIYSSRLYTNRTVLAAVGKPYIPVEDGELGKSVRKMIARQLEYSAIVAWESRPRDLLGEAVRAEELGLLSPETKGMVRHDYTVGQKIPLSPGHPPWGVVQHRGWSSPAQQDDGEMPNLQFATVLAELPNLVEARAVSLAPVDPTATPTKEAATADPVVVDVLRRPATMGMREYLTQLSYLGLVNPPAVGQSFLSKYERARFGGIALTESDFKSLMSTFSELMSGMYMLDKTIVQEVRAQASTRESLAVTDTYQPPSSSNAAPQIPRLPSTSSLSPPHTPTSSVMSPVTAQTGPSRNVTPYMQTNASSSESFSSVIHNRVSDEFAAAPLDSARLGTSGSTSSSLRSFASDAGSVVRHRSSSP